ncbi:MAG: hypothetical protein Q4F30_05705 [Akkermansia sp.]|nr:hypothetical protein [Akkermansia sp.]
MPRTMDMLGRAALPLMAWALLAPAPAAEPWLHRVPVPAAGQLTRVDPPPGQSGFAYESRNYRFYTQVELPPESRAAIARVFEHAFAASRAIAAVLPVERARQERGERKYRVYLTRNMQSYHANGGPVGSTGVFKHAVPALPGSPAAPLREEDLLEDLVIVPFPSLGLDETGRPLQGAVVPRTLVHELTHQNFVLNALPAWADEGWAEYVGYVPCADGALDFDAARAAITEQAKARAAAGLLHFPFTLARFLSMPRQELYRHMGGGKCDPYMLSAMLVTYFVQLSGERGVSAMRAWLSALRTPLPPDQALPRLLSPHGSPGALQQDFLQAWQQQGITDISFAVGDDGGGD